MGSMIAILIVVALLGASGYYIWSILAGGDDDKPYCEKYPDRPKSSSIDMLLQCDVGKKCINQEKAFNDLVQATDPHYDGKSETEITFSCKAICVAFNEIKKCKCTNCETTCHESCGLSNEDYCNELLSCGSPAFRIYN